jgi:hypothetical protein
MFSDSKIFSSEVIDENIIYGNDNILNIIKEYLLNILTIIYINIEPNIFPLTIIFFIICYLGIKYVIKKYQPASKETTLDAQNVNQNIKRRIDPDTIPDGYLITDTDQASVSSY